MKVMRFGPQETPSALEVFASARVGKEIFFLNKGTKISSEERGEPRSVLETLSPSPTTSTSTPSSVKTTGLAAVADNNCHKWPPTSPLGATPSSSSGGEWEMELQPIPAVLEYWETLPPEAPPPPPSELGSEHGVLQWVTAEYDAGAGVETDGIGLGFVDPGFVHESTVGTEGESLLHAMVSSQVFSLCGSANNSFKGAAFGNSNFKTTAFGSFSSIMNQNQVVPSCSNLFFLPLDNQPAIVTPPPPAFHHHQSNSISDQEVFLDINTVHLPLESFSLHQAVLDKLFKAAELLEVGNTVSAQMILARLNYHLPSPSGKPFIRSAFYFKEAFLFGLQGRAFSDVSPVLQFTSFTSTQAILDELTGAKSIHVIDFNIGIGGNWCALIQELSQRHSSSNGSIELRISAFVSNYSHHPLELQLIQENLTNFAANLGVPFLLKFLPLESFDPTVMMHSSIPGEAIAVNFTIGFGNDNTSTQTFLRLIKQLSPKIVISVNHGCDRNDLPFSHHFLHAFRSSTILLESIEATGVSPEVADKIEKYLLQPRIESSIIRCYKAGGQEQLLPWRRLFTSAGFLAVPFSSFAEAQAEFLLKRMQVKGFQMHKHQAALMLSWKQGEIVSISAWRC
ncbi:hypothetical protein HPP92_002601 [Vanilla planifolia]|uniref:Scarecrow-like protein 6 n=1 Tax=Vanilla planifolia TaxID=51239 RepID=A0A835S082_VANPL|nr:hypothetical protein HPP92_002601 [Vanilla planifolia]